MSNFSQDNTRIQSVSVISATEIAEGWSANPMRQVVLYNWTLDKKQLLA